MWLICWPIWISISLIINHSDIYIIYPQKCVKILIIICNLLYSCICIRNMIPIIKSSLYDTLYLLKQANHNNGVIMGTIASQITSLTIIYSKVYSDADQRKHQSSASLAFVWGNSSVTGEFPAQMASNAENVSLWWCHHVKSNPHEIILDRAYGVFIVSYLFTAALRTSIMIS